MVVYLVILVNIQIWKSMRSERSELSIAIENVGVALVESIGNGSIFELDTTTNR